MKKLEFKFTGETSFYPEKSEVILTFAQVVMVEKERLLKVKRMTTSETRTVSTQEKLAV